MPVTAKGDIDKEAKDSKRHCPTALWFERLGAQQAGALRRAQQAPLGERGGLVGERGLAYSLCRKALC